MTDEAIADFCLKKTTEEVKEKNASTLVEAK
jgi:hypothetical protein